VVRVSFLNRSGRIGSGGYVANGVRAPFAGCRGEALTVDAKAQPPGKVALGLRAEPLFPLMYPTTCDTEYFGGIDSIL
jgi:hypothetical protein